jgi:hypothetical protein
MNMLLNFLPRFCQAFLRTWLALLLMTPALHAEENVQLSGISLEIVDSQGGTAVAVFDTELPAGETVLLLPAIFSGDIGTTSLSATFNDTEIEILSGLSVALASGAEAYFEDFNYLAIDVSTYHGQSGEVTIEMTSTAEAELFIMLSGVVLNSQGSVGLDLVLLKAAMDK